MNGNEIAVQNDRQIVQALTANDITARVFRMQEVVKNVMKEGEHYGTIPGCKQKSLYKPGAELLLMTFQVANKVANVEDLSTPDEIHYRVTVAGISQITGAFLGDHAGECSSSEEKYKWQRPVCDEEWNETAVDRRRETWKRGQGGKTYKVKQIRTNPADVANTILAMAEKRAMVGMTRSVTAASSMFTDGIEDLPPGVLPEDADENGKTSIKEPRSKSEKTNQPPAADGVKFELITKEEREALFKLADEAGVSNATLHIHLREVYKIEHSNVIRKAWYRGITEWVRNGGQNIPEEK